MKALLYIAPLVVGLVFAISAAANEAEDAAGSNPTVVKLGKITPNGPYRLWNAINNVLPEYALSKGGRGLKSRVEGLTAFSFDGKTPGDVLARVAEYRATRLQ